RNGLAVEDERLERCDLPHILPRIDAVVVDAGDRERERYGENAGPERQEKLTRETCRRFSILRRLARLECAEYVAIAEEIPDRDEDGYQELPKKVMEPSAIDEKIEKEAVRAQIEDRERREEGHLSAHPPRTEGAVLEGEEFLERETRQR